MNQRFILGKDKRSKNIAAVVDEDDDEDIEIMI